MLDLNFTLFFLKKKYPDLFVTKVRFRIWMLCTATTGSVGELKGLQALLKAIHLMPIAPQRYTFGSVQVDVERFTAFEHSPHSHFVCFFFFPGGGGGGVIIWDFPAK